MQVNAPRWSRTTRTGSSSQVFGRETRVRAASAGAGETGRRRRDGTVRLMGRALPGEVVGRAQGHRAGAASCGRVAHRRKAHVTQKLLQEEEQVRRACSVHWRTAEAPVPCCCKAEQVRCSSLGSAGPQEEALRQLCVSFASAAPACVSGRAEVPKRPRGSSRAAIKQRRPTPAGKSWSGGGGDLSAALRSEAAESSTPQRGERAARSWRGRLPLRRRPRRRR
jgi:hypothetical protein